MNFAGVVAAVFFANMLTVAFVWGLSRASRYQKDTDIPGWVFVALLLPLAVVALAFIGAGWTPPFLTAFAAP